MFANKFRIFGLLLYKNYLIRKRYWKSALFFEVLTTLLLFLAVLGLRDLVPPMPPELSNSTSTKYKSRSASDYLKESGKTVLVVPDNQFAQNLARRVRRCLNNRVSTFNYHTEEDMLRAHQENQKFHHAIALIFEDNNVNYSTENLKYKIESPSSFPTSLYSELLRADDDVFEQEFTALQLCVDQSLIQIKKNDLFRVQIKTQKMPKPAQAESNSIESAIKQLFCGFAVSAFVIPLCIETSHASEEKFLGINVLMAMNGVPNYLNLLSWLASGLFISLFYTVPIVLIIACYTTEDVPISFIHYGNPFIFWLLLTLNVAHLISFGIHVSAYFTRSLFMSTGILILYTGALVLARHAIRDNALGVVPFLGVIFPNLLLFRGCEEINYYEDIRKGLTFGNLFDVGNKNYGLQGSVGMVLIFSVIGIVLHLLMANYVCAINPGKYGVRKGPFYFLKFLKRKKKVNDQGKVESFEFNDVNNQPFEPVTENIYAPGIQIRNLKKMYRTSLLSQAKVYALRGVSVDFYQGQITALLGHNGAGKTTMMSILSGMIGPTEGLVLVNGKNVKDEIDEIMNDTGLCPQENMLFPQLSVFEQMRFFAMLKNKNKSMPVTDTDVAQLLSQLKLLEKQNALPNELSGGQKRRVCLGMALVGNSSTLILDEPTSGLDPESKRDIWNVLLRIKGRRTILISTHDMEEADILGDRIAIMHMGQLKSYGTPMFLKKLMGGENIELTLSTEPRCNTAKVCSFLDEESQVVGDVLGKIVLNVPNNEKLPDCLDELEQNKKDLGITGMSVSVITLEKVFLKVIEDNSDASKTHQPFAPVTEKLDSGQKIWQTWRGLLFKKAAYTLKNISSVITLIILLVVALLCSIFILMDHSSSSTKEIPVRTDMYHNVEDYYKIYKNSKKYGNSYKKIVSESDASTIEYANRTSLADVLLNIGSHDLSDYYYRHVIAAEFVSNQANNIIATAFYNPKLARYAQPISINLVSNAILKTVTNESNSIEISVQEMPEIETFTITTPAMILFDSVVASVLFTFFLFPAVALFVVHPIRETLTNIKHLERMAGVSCFSYWGTMFVFDFLVFIYTIICLIIGFIIADRVLGLNMFGAIEALILLALLSLFIINILPLVYISSFWGKSTTSAIKLLTLLPLGLVLVEIIMIVIKLAIKDENQTINTIRPIQKGIFFLTPYISFLHGQIAFFNNSKTNGDCKRLYQYNKDMMCFSDTCCEMKCTDGTCENVASYFGGLTDDVSLSSSFLALCLTPILYFSVLYILENKIVEKVIAGYYAGMPENSDATFEEQVKNVKREIAFEISKLGIEGVNTGKYQSTAENENEEVAEEDEESKSHVFLVYELRKLYGKFIAVHDISFGVKESECFGLLGVNGAGKSTTFKMMTGEIIPNHGILHLRDKNSKDNQNYLENLGYCPQNDAIIRSLNSYDHLRLFARLRGIPENKVEDEVQNWIDKLNLNVCARQPSGTYSGGNKRRLNIAMALIGVPSMVLLDEPTTGVDPAARRSLWTTIQSCQAMGQAVILTSHSMEECEALCNRLAIMVDGKFVCIGPSVELKQRFGAGYDVQIQMNPEKSRGEIDGIKQDLIGALPCEVVDENSGYLKCHVSSANITWRQMHNVMIGLKNNYSCIEDYCVLSSTLEQLFLIFAKSANKTNRRYI